jgi:hypothetical protein
MKPTRTISQTKHKLFDSTEELVMAKGYRRL